MFQYQSFACRMSHWHLHGIPCNECRGNDRDSTVSSVGVNVNISYNSLIQDLWGVKELMFSRLYTTSYRAQFDTLVNRLHDLDTVVPYRPPSAEIIQKVRLLIATIHANQPLIAGAFQSTGHSLMELERAIQDHNPSD